MKSKTNELSFVLKPSRIHGIGVFATHDIEKGTKLRFFPRSDKFRTLKKSEKYEYFLKTYCVSLGKKRYSCPKDFGRMSIGWYLNHSDSPNAYHKKYTYYAGRDIKSGEEITINYKTL